MFKNKILHEFSALMLCFSFYVIYTWLMFGTFCLFFFSCYEPWSQYRLISAAKTFEVLVSLEWHAPVIHQSYISLHNENRLVITKLTKKEWPKSVIVEIVLAQKNVDLSSLSFSCFKRLNSWWMVTLPSVQHLLLFHVEVISIKCIDKMLDTSTSCFSYSNDMFLVL